MVGPRLRLVPSLILSLIAAAPCRSQETLLQMQREICAIVRAARGGVVSIEDERITMIGSVDIEKIQASALRDAMRGVEEAMGQLDKSTKVRGKAEPGDPSDPEKAARAKVEMSRKLGELAQRKTEITRSIHEQMRRFMPMIAVDAPKAGSGFHIGGGFVVTTADVLEGMKRPVVVTDDGTRIRAEIVGMDSDLNIGLLKLPQQADLTSLKCGRSSGVEVGHFAISIGNQSGQINSVSLALVAGVRGNGTFAGSRFYPSLIQIAGTVGAGTSGAPLISARGDVIGMLAAVPAGEWAETRLPIRIRSMPAPDQGSGAGDEPRAAPGHSSSDDGQAEVTFIRPPVTSAGFAIPIDEVREAVEQLRSGKPRVRGWIGITSRDEQQYQDEGPISRLKRLVRIETVFPDSPAARAGIRIGDIMETLDGKPVVCSTDVRATSLCSQPGQMIIAVVRRGPSTLTLNLKIDLRPLEIKRPPRASPTKRTQ